MPKFYLYGPHFDTTITGAYPFSVFQATIDSLLSGVQPTGTPTPTPTPTSTPLPPVNFFEMESYAIQGAVEAPVLVVAFADFQCPFSKSHYERTLPHLIADYVNPGLVRYMVKDLPILTTHPQAQQASEAAECAGAQGRYWPMHDRLYDQQQLWSGASNATDLFKQYARELGLNGGAFDACLENGTFTAEVLADRQEGLAAGIRGVPTFFFFGPNGSAILPGAYPYSAFQQIIDSLLDGKSPMIELATDQPPATSLGP